MSRNVIAIIVVASILGGLKGVELLFKEITGESEHTNSQNWEDRELINRQSIQTLKIGNSLESVTNMMGIADFNEIIMNGDTKYQVLFYRTQRTKDDGMTTKDECTPLVFVNQSLVGWGDNFFSALIS